MRGYTKKPAEWGRHWKAVALVALLALALAAPAACGGDGDDEPSPSAATTTAAAETPTAEAETEEAAAAEAEAEAQAEAAAEVEAEAETEPAEDEAETEEPAEAAATDEAEAEAADEAPPPGPFPLTVTDDTGVEVTLEARPERVVAVLPSVVDLVADLGLADRLVGVDDFSLARAPDAVSVGGANFTFNIEAIAELQPDLVLLAVGGTEELAQQSRALGFPVYSMAYPDRVATVLEQLRTIGRLLGEEEAAATLAADLDARLAAVSEAVAAALGSAEPLRVYLEVDQSTPAQPFSVGPGSLHQEIIELAGGANIFADAEGPFPQVGWESIIAADPEVILLLNSKEFADEMSFNPISAAEVGERTGWGEITAVREGMVVPLPGTLFSVGVGLVEAVERVAEALAEARMAAAA